MYCCLSHQRVVLLEYNLFKHVPKSVTLLWQTQIQTIKYFDAQSYFWQNFCHKKSILIFKKKKNNKYQQSFFQDLLALLAVKKKEVVIIFYSFTVHPTVENVNTDLASCQIAWFLPVKRM